MAQVQGTRANLEVGNILPESEEAGHKFLMTFTSSQQLIMDQVKELSQVIRDGRAQVQSL
jgi:hypothetical protein